MYMHVGCCRDLNGYVALCSVSTFGSLLTTIVLLVVPASFWQRLEAEGVASVWRQAAVGISMHAQALVRRSSVTPWHAAARAAGRSEAAVPRLSGAPALSAAQVCADEAAVDGVTCGEAAAYAGCLAHQDAGPVLLLRPAMPSAEGSSLPRVTEACGRRFDP